MARPMPKARYTAESGAAFILRSKPGVSRSGVQRRSTAAARARVEAALAQLPETNASPRILTNAFIPAVSSVKVTALEYQQPSNRK